MLSPTAAYLKGQLFNHVGLFFADEAMEMIRRADIRFVSYAEAQLIRNSTIAIPTDIPIPKAPENPCHVEFNATRLTLWNRLPQPDGDGWDSLPSAATPLWYRHRSGTVMPAWNLYGNLFELLTLGEELRSSLRDCHGRFAASMSSRKSAGLLEVPALNEAAAALVAACAGMKGGESPITHLDGLCGPLVAVLSHDCDILRGNDFWTQMVRCFRIIQPVTRGRPPALKNLWWMVRNAIAPKRFYFDNVTGMIDLESTFGFTSTFYLINGTGGRFGARSEPEMLRELVAVCPPEWDIGMHYNYDTLLNHDRFRAQMDQLKEIVPNPIKAGRAHYLRFDSRHSLKFLESFGIRCDESAGYADSIGYRCGVGGCIQGYDVESNRTLDIYEVPLIVMDATLVSQYPDDAIAAFRRIVRHLSRIGGAVSVVFHPGQFHNPEFPPMHRLYHRMLIELRDAGAVSRTALSLVNKLRGA